MRCLVEHGLDKGMDADFRTSVCEDRRRFSLDWFSKKLPNGESTKHNWLIFQKLKNLFLVFAAYYLEKFFKDNKCHILPITKEDFQTGNICTDWKSMKIHLNIKNSYLEWRFLGKRLKTEGP
jgi:hypothetical protein